VRLTTLQFALCLAAAALTSCRPEPQEVTPPTTGTASPPTSAPAEAEPPASQPALVLSSPAFDSGKPIPRRHTGEGEDLSPPLVWSGLPPGTLELALICDDPDAPRPTPWVHWVRYGIPPTTRSLPEGAARPGVDGANSWPEGKGYRGPMPPPGHGVHHYHFRLYALDTTLDLEPGATKAQLLAAMQDHILAMADLVGTYER
jgi:Raf kinase inhibitor-like YbhB/YbcL family protein